MKLAKVKFKKLKKSLSKIIIEMGDVIMDVSELCFPPMPGPVREEVKSLVIKGKGLIGNFFADSFQDVRDEINTNFSMPIDLNIKKKYLQEIYDFYSDIEDKITENEDGSLSASTELVEFKRISLDKLDKMNRDFYDEFITGLKESLREEILHLRKLYNAQNSLHRRHKPPIPKSFELQNKDTELEDISTVLKSLKENKFVHKDTDIKIFRRIFKGLEPKQPIRWIGTQEELRYFTRYINGDSEIIKKIKSNLWEVVAHCFVDENSTHYNPVNLRTAGNPTPDRAEKLETISSYFLG